MTYRHFMAVVIVLTLAVAANSAAGERAIGGTIAVTQEAGHQAH